MKFFLKREASLLDYFLRYLLITILTFFIYGFGWFSGSSKPDWVDHFIDENHFVGQSSLLPKDQISKARVEAFDAALDQISRRLGVIIESEFRIKEESTKSGVVSQISRESKQSASHFLQDIKKSDEYIESEKNGQIVYVLIKMSDSEFKALEKRVAQEKEEYNLILDEVDKALSVGDVQSAKSQLARAADSVYGKGSKRLAELERILNDLIVLSASLNKEFYVTGEPIEISITVNKNAYIYVLSQAPEYIKVIFPNEADLQNYIQAGSQLSIPTKKMVDENYLFKMEDLKDKTEQISVIATKSPIEIASLSKSIRGGYYELESSQKAKWREKISSLMKSGDLTIKGVNPLSNKNESKDISLCLQRVKSSSLVGDNIISKAVMDKVTDYFGKSGFIISGSECAKTDSRVGVLIESEMVYNPSLDDEVVSLTLTVTLYDTKGEELSSESVKLYYTKGSDKELSTAISKDDTLTLSKTLSYMIKEKNGNKNLQPQ